MSAMNNQLFAGHQNDFEGVVSRYSPVLYRVALRRLRNTEDAADAVQDALLSAHKCIGQFNIALNCVPGLPALSQTSRS